MLNLVTLCFQTESPLLVQPYIQHATRSELHAIMTAGFATIAGNVLGPYISFGVRMFWYQFMGNTTSSFFAIVIFFLYHCCWIRRPKECPFCYMVGHRSFGIWMECPKELWGFTFISLPPKCESYPTTAEYNHIVRLLWLKIYICKETTYYSSKGNLNQRSAKYGSWANSR